MNVRNNAATAMASSGRKSRVASVVFVILAQVPPSLAVRAPVARAQSWGEVVLNSFDEADGQYSFADVIQGSDGNFFGTTEYGGANPAIGNLANAAGTVFKLTPSGDSQCSLEEAYAPVAARKWKPRPQDDRGAKGPASWRNFRNSTKPSVL